MTTTNHPNRLLGGYLSLQTRAVYFVQCELFLELLLSVQHETKKQVLENNPLFYNNSYPYYTVQHAPLNQSSDMHQALYHNYQIHTIYYHAKNIPHRYPQRQ